LSGDPAILGGLLLYLAVMLAVGIFA